MYIFSSFFSLSNHPLHCCHVNVNTAKVLKPEHESVILVMNKLHFSAFAASAIWCNSEMSLFANRFSMLGF